MIYDLPTSVEIDGKSYKIRNNCDYRVVLDVIETVSDMELSDFEQASCALYIFYEESKNIENLQTAITEMMRIINGGELAEEEAEPKPKVMDWIKDFKFLAPPISRVLGYDVRTPGKYTHWWTFLGAYMEIGECTFQTIVSIRQKIQKGQKLESYEREFYNEHRKDVELPQMMSREEFEELNSEW